MTLRNIPGCAVLRALCPVLLACPALAACSNTPALPADAFVGATLGPSRDMSGNNLCAFGNPLAQLTIGTAASMPKTVTDGNAQSNGNVTIQCSVQGGFHVSLQAGLGGPSGGTLVVTGSVDSSTGGSGITGSLVTGDGEFDETDCTISYKYLGQPVPTMPFVAPGRIWGHLSCPHMLNNSGKSVSITGPSGMPMQVAETCDGEVDFLFENCGQ